jgi:hypothetical protein
MQEDIIPASLQLLNSNLLLVPLGQWVHVLGTASSTLPHPVPTLELPCSYHRLRSSNPAASASHQHPHPTGKIRTTLTPHHHSPVTSKLLCYSRIQVPGRRKKKKQRGKKMFSPTHMVAQLLLLLHKENIFFLSRALEVDT